MPWKVLPVSEIRFAACQAVRTLHQPVAAVARRFAVSRWQPSPRACPPTLPELTYPAGSILRKVSTVGDIRCQGYRILCGRGITGQLVRIEERPQELAVFYAWKQIRVLPLLSRDQRRPDIML